MTTSAPRPPVASRTHARALARLGHGASTSSVRVAPIRSREREATARAPDREHLARAGERRERRRCSDRRVRRRARRRGPRGALPRDPSSPSRCSARSRRRCTCARSRSRGSRSRLRARLEPDLPRPSRLAALARGERDAVDLARGTARRGFRDEAVPARAARSVDVEERGDVALAKGHAVDVAHLAADRLRGRRRRRAPGRSGRERRRACRPRGGRRCRRPRSTSSARARRRARGSASRASRCARARPARAGWRRGSRLRGVPDAGTCVKRATTPRYL